MTEGPRNVAPDWYPDPSMANTLRYWDGQKWTDHIAPVSEPNGDPSGHMASTAQSRTIAVMIVVGAVIGLIMSMQSASLLTGTGSLWTGVAIVVGATIAAWMLRKSTPRWVRIVVTIMAVFAIANVVYVEIQLEEMRQGFGDLLE